MKGKTTPLLANCPDKHQFRTIHGAVFRNYADLLDGLKRMDDATFRAHVNEGKNDFKNWVLHVYSDEKLAKDFEARPTRLTMAQNTARRLKALALEHG
ncbi:hypothetical protein HY492_02380 [Candidatus Woesearchaeota archaeon]|nr:hypothetical protein [Candidatus Woesearchaeota archaeon]